MWKFAGRAGQQSHAAATNAIVFLIQISANYYPVFLVKFYLYKIQFQ